MLETLQMAGPLRSTDIAPLHRYYRRHPLVDFPVSPVIRPTLLRRFLAGTRRVSPVAQHVLVTVLSLPPRQGEQPRRSDFGCSCCLRPPVAGSALGGLSLSRPQRVHFCYGPVTRDLPPGDLV